MTSPNPRTFPPYPWSGGVTRSNQHNVLVTYEERIDDDGQHLEEEVDVEHIRSYPPVVEHYLNEGDNVDVFSRDGWWRGKVILEHETDLVVYFSEMPRNRQHVTYERDHVRIHQEWFDVGCHSSWIHLKQSALATNHHHLQTAQDRHNQATVLRVYEDRLFFGYDSLIDNNDDAFQEEVNLQYIRSYPPTVRHQLCIHDDVEVWDHEGWWRGNVLLQQDTNLFIYFDYKTRG
ncbi:hypothetical protein LXL04_003804 [Taraxacum kok-saghyz]